MVIWIRKNRSTVLGRFYSARACSGNGRPLPFSRPPSHRCRPPPPISSAAATGRPAFALLVQIHGAPSPDRHRFVHIVRSYPNPMPPSNRSNMIFPPLESSCSAIPIPSQASGHGQPICSTIACTRSAPHRSFLVLATPFARAREPDTRRAPTPAASSVLEYPEPGGRKGTSAR